LIEERHASLTKIRCSQNTVSIEDSRDEGGPIFGDERDREYRIPLAEITREMGRCTSAIAGAFRKMEGRVQKCKFSTMSPWPQLLQGERMAKRVKIRRGPKPEYLKIPFSSLKTR
jgi:hypothetical protein